MKTTLAYPNKRAFHSRSLTGSTGLSWFFRVFLLLAMFVYGWGPHFLHECYNQLTGLDCGDHRCIANVSTKNHSHPADCSCLEFQFPNHDELIGRIVMGEKHSGTMTDGHCPICLLFAQQLWQVPSEFRLSEGSCWRPLCPTLPVAECVWPILVSARGPPVS